MKKPKPISYIASAKGTARVSKARPTKASKATDKKLLLESVDGVRRQVETQLREQGCKQPATEAESIAAKAYGRSVEAIRRAKTRARRIKDT